MVVKEGQSEAAANVPLSGRRLPVRYTVVVVAIVVMVNAAVASGVSLVAVVFTIFCARPYGTSGRFIHETKAKNR